MLDKPKPELYLDFDWILSIKTDPLYTRYKLEYTKNRLQGDIPPEFFKWVSIASEVYSLITHSFVFDEYEKGYEDFCDWLKTQHDRWRKNKLSPPWKIDLFKKRPTTFIQIDVSTMKIIGSADSLLKWTVFNAERYKTENNSECSTVGS